MIFIKKNLWFLKINLIKFCLQSKSSHIRPLSHLNFDLKLTEPWDVMFTFQNNVFLGHFEVQCRNWISRMGELKDWGALGAGKVQTKFNFFWIFSVEFQRGNRWFLDFDFFFENFLKGRIDVKNRVTDSHSDGEARSCCLCGSAAAAAAAAAAPTE